MASLNTLFRVSDEVALVGTVGRGFRSPNLIERFFDGPTPEGAGYQVSNPDLAPETSLNADLGVRYRGERVALELFGFRNKIRDGIRVEALGFNVGGFPAFQNTNVDELIYRGVELGGDLALGAGFSVTGGYTWMDTEDANDAANPVGDSFASKLTGALRYDAPADRFWGVGEIRHNGEQKDVDLGGSNPVGDVLPSFTVVDLRAGVTVWQSAGMRHELTAVLGNVTDALYAEFANVGFFRPEPGRNLTLSWLVTF